MEISIVAPNFISIHTPTQGVTELAKLYLNNLYDFNPHSHAGSDDTPMGSLQDPFSISIHTPTQGVTCYDYVDDIQFCISIHTPTQGVSIR
ncbi:Uncharacterised protein [[Eubacterium] contortum]|uniref:Uncharacterized protein n=1 Tax=Faecalicatena contorta TaxID=39482 RepID=A0A174NI04_9FIRM|nr:Uncharacterised protein [[Eubacterium] contortum] [Faecalicatena contorta]